MSRPFVPPEPPYFAVIFASQRIGADPGYDRMAAEMERLALAHPGCLGMDSARGADGFGITVSYWKDEAAIRSWKADPRHLAAQRQGARAWYSAYSLQVAEIGRAYTGPREIP